MRRGYTYFEAYLDSMHEVNIYLALSNYNGKSDVFYIEDEDHNQIPLHIEADMVEGEYHKYFCSFHEEIIFGRHYKVFHEHARSCDLVFAEVVKTREFDELFYYDKDDLGMTYTKEKTTFKVWAPTAYDVVLELEKGGERSFHVMERNKQGVYGVSIQEDVLGASYMYLVSVNGKVNKTIDPYGKASTPNSKRSVVVDVNAIQIETYDLPKMESNCDAILYEVNVKDYTQKGTLRSFVDDPIFSYIKELGVTHLQFLPLLDFKSVDELDVSRYYNWGYDSYQWMALENSYGENPRDPFQVMQDMAYMVNTCHRNGLRVNLDVVFNHVYDIDDCALEKCIPYYYFQYTKEDGFSSATMCGNDVDSTRKMCRKIIVDSCRYLQDTFHIDGLRFDLMGILDVDTLNEVVSVCRKNNENFMVYGEGWNMPSYLAESKRAAIPNNHLMPEVAHFSDRFRDTLKGSTDASQVQDLGYLLSDTRKIFAAMNVFGGSTQNIGNNALFTNAKQVVNYVECHDNMTSWDKIDKAMSRSMQVKKLHHRLLIASLFLAQGIPFLHGGQEFARSKKGKNNTYNDNSGVNRIDCMLMEKNKELIDYTKEWITLRKRYSCLRQPLASTIFQNVSYGSVENVMLQYHVADEKDDLMVFINPSYTKFPLHVEKNYEMIYYNAILAKPETPDYVDVYGLTIVIFRKMKKKHRFV